MLRAMIFLAAFLPAIALPAAGRAAEEVHEVLPDDSSRDIKKELDLKLKTTAAFLKAARQIADANRDNEAVSYMKRADSLAAEAQSHYKAGEFKYAAEDLSEATQMAIHAIIISKEKQDASVRDFAIQEEIILKERHDRERKIELINKGMAEAEVFIKAAERLLAGTENEAARKELEEAKALFESARASLGAGRHDDSLNSLDRAYTLATRSVKDIKRAQGDIITFPKPAFNTEKEMLAHELKKNNSYVFFATQVVRGGDQETSASFRKGRELRDEALTAMDKGEAKKAIERFRASTEFLIRAIKGGKSL